MTDDREMQFRSKMKEYAAAIEALPLDQRAALERLMAETAQRHAANIREIARARATADRLEILESLRDISERSLMHRLDSLAGA